MKSEEHNEVTNHKENEEEASASTQEHKMAELEEELKNYKDKYLRLLAEMENARKRMQKEKLEVMRYGTEGILSEILPPMDNLENALKHAGGMSEEVKKWAAGFQMILAQLKEVLSEHKVVAFVSEGKPFDPHLHEAVETEETDEYPEGTVIKEFIRGYKCEDRILRPARVKVSKKPQKHE